MLNYFNILFLLRSISFSGTTSLRLIYYRTRCDRAVYGVVLCLPVYLSQDITESKWLNVWLMLYDSPDVIVFWRFRIIRRSGNVVTVPHSGGPLFLSLTLQEGQLLPRERLTRQMSVEPCEMSHKCSSNCI